MASYDLSAQGFVVKGAALDETLNPVATYDDLLSLISISYAGNRIIVKNNTSESPFYNIEGQKYFFVEYILTVNGLRTQWLVNAFLQPFPSINFLNSVSSLDDYKTIRVGLKAVVIENNIPVEYIATEVVTGTDGRVTWTKKESTGGEIEYAAGSGITISTNKIGVNIAEDTEERENFLNINADNELEVTEITSDALVTSKDIEAAKDNEWADEVSSVFSDGRIPSGITLQDFLEKMIAQEKWGTPSVALRINDSIINNTNIVFSDNIEWVKETIGNEVVDVAYVEGDRFTIHQNIPSLDYGVKIGYSGYTYGFFKQGPQDEQPVEVIDATEFLVRATPIKTVNVLNRFLYDEAFATLRPNGVDDFLISDGTREIIIGDIYGESVDCEIRLFVKGDLTNSLTHSESSTTIYNRSNKGEIRDSDKKSLGNCSYRFDPFSHTIKRFHLKQYYPIYYICGNATSYTKEKFFNSGFNIQNTDNKVRVLPEKIKITAGTGTFFIAIPSTYSGYDTITKVRVCGNAGMPLGVSNMIDTNGIDSTEKFKLTFGNKQIEYKVFFISNANPTTSDKEYTVRFE